jgi:hypothetical protein
MRALVVVLATAGCTGTIGDAASDPLAGAGVSDPANAPVGPTSGADLDASAPASGDPPAAPDAPIAKAKAADVAVSAIDVLQGVAVPLMRAGELVPTQRARVVAGRAGLVRVFVTPSPAFRPREIIGELRIGGGPREIVIRSKLSPISASTESDLASTMNFDVPAGAFGMGATIAVALFESGAESGGDTTKSSWPGSGAAAIDVVDTGEKLRIVLVPFRYDADGSGRLPELGADQLALYRRAFEATFPARAVEVTVRAPISFSTPIQRGGAGFSEALEATIALRAADGAAKDVYYHGIFTPAATAEQYCNGGCVAGLCGLLTQAGDSVNRACVGIGFRGPMSAQTAIHEIGHAHGRAHVPCGSVAGADSRYPYEGGAIGSWGWDPFARKLIEPSKTRDFMSYCNPTWISDYTYGAIANRMATVARSVAARVVGGPFAYKFLRVDDRGGRRWGRTVVLDEPPLGEPHDVTYEDAAGRVVDRATAAWYPYDDLAGGHYLVPESSVAHARVRIDGIALP